MDKAQENKEKEKEWDDFLEALDEIVLEERKKISDEFKNNPKTWEELLQRIDELPGDDLLTWYKYREPKNN